MAKTFERFQTYVGKQGLARLTLGGGTRNLRIVATIPRRRRSRSGLSNLLGMAGWGCLFLVIILGNSAGAQELGATVNKSGHSTTGVEFRVWVPNGLQVSVAGDFNGWNSLANVLSKNATTSIWSGTVAGARPGHAYKYVITTAAGTQLWRKDPRARQVRTLADGTQAAVIYDPGAFVWDDDGYEPPFPNEIVMYELHVGSFYDPTPSDGEPATLYHAALKLDYLRDLGVNMIALMPVGEFNGRHSWGYNPTALFAIEEAYGGPDALKYFVNEAHKRGMAVQVDVVHNHYGDLAAAGASDLENFDGGEPYFYNAADEQTRPGISRTKWGPRPRYSDANVRQFIADNIRMYLDEYKVWALRWDSPRNITGYDHDPGQQIGDADTTIPEAVTMMEQINSSIHSRNIRYYSIAEDANSPGGYSGHWEISFHNVIFPRLLALTQNGTLPAPFAGRLDYPFLNTRSGPNIGYRLETKENPGFRVVFSENHDKCGNHNAATDGARLASDFDPAHPDSLAARRKTMLAAVLTLTAAGTPMLWMGQEQLAQGQFDDAVAMDWLRAGRFEGMVRFHRDLIRLRRNADGKSLALTYTSLPDVNDLRGVVSMLNGSEDAGWMVYERKTGNPEESILVAVNFSTVTRTAFVAAPAAGNWRVFLNSDSKTYGNELGGSRPTQGESLATSGENNILLFPIAPLSAVVLGKAVAPVVSADSNANGIADGWEMLFAAGNATADIDSDGFNNLAEFENGTDPGVPDRAALAGAFNNWNIVSKTMRWDSTRSVWRYVAKFSERGWFNGKAYMAGGWSIGNDGWAPGEDTWFDVAQEGTLEITYNPAGGNYTVVTVNSDANSNGLSDAWEAFYFYPSSVASPSADPDGDGFTNLQEFGRGSDPTAFDQPAMGVVGAYNGWNWNARNMRYTGHGVWTGALFFPKEPADKAYKFGVGPASTDSNWGQPTASASDGYKSNLDFQWPLGVSGWRIVRFNEKTSATSVLSPGVVDSDGDSMPDDWERAFGLDAYEAGVLADADADGVWDRFEWTRGSNPLIADRSPAMSFVFGPEWNPGLAKFQMFWNANAARWEAAFYAPRAGTLEFRFASGSWSHGSWGWEATGVEGVALKEGSKNMLAAWPARGWYLISFEEFSGTYAIETMPDADLNLDGMPDSWARVFELNSALSDEDLDGVANLTEFRRGGSPKLPDHFQQMNLVGDLNGWNFLTHPMRWNAVDGFWELLIRTTSLASNQEAKFVAGLAWSNPNWGDTNADGIADANAPTGGGIRYTIPSLPGYFHFQFDEITGEYSAGVMSPSDANGDGLADVWADYHGVSGAAANPDGDPFVNAQELARGSNPLVVDSYFRNFARMRVVGDFKLLNGGWSTTDNSTLMQLVGDHLWRLDYAGFQGTGTRRFKFLAGDSWSASNWGDKNGDGICDQQNDNDISYAQNSAGPYRFEFNDLTLEYAVRLMGQGFSEAYPGIAPDQTVRGRFALLDYLFGGTALEAPDNSNLPIGKSEDGKLQMSFVTRGEDSSVNYVVEVSTDLLNWSSIGIEKMPDTPVGNGLFRHIHEIPIDGPRKFLRLRATLQE